MGDDAESVADLPPSAKFTHFVLDADGPMDTAELTEATTLTKRVVRYGLNRLQEVDAVEKRRLPGDARKVEYHSLTEFPGGIDPTERGDVDG